MVWSSTQEIVDHFGLEAPPDDYEAIDRELRARISELHPDKSGGEFNSADRIIEYDDVKTARDFVSTLKHSSRNLVAIHQLPALLNAMQLAQNTQTQGNDRQLRAEVRDENRKDLHSRYVAPRVGSGVFGAITGALFMFSESLADHPVLGSLTANYEMQVVLLALSVYSAFFFGLTWYFEQRAEAKIDFLLSEEGIQLLFEELVPDLRYEGGHFQFSTRKFASIVSKYCSARRSVGSLPVFFGRQRVKPSTIDRIVQLHLSEWESRGVIRKREAPSVDRVYIVDADIIKDLNSHSLR